MNEQDNFPNDSFRTQAIVRLEGLGITGNLAERIVEATGSMNLLRMTAQEIRAMRDRVIRPAGDNLFG